MNLELFYRYYIFGYIKFPNRTVAFVRGDFGSPFVRRLFTLKLFNDILRSVACNVSPKD
jgi:hypothetical protein